MHKLVRSIPFWFHDEIRLVLLIHTSDCEKVDETVNKHARTLFGDSFNFASNSNESNLRSMGSSIMIYLSIKFSTYLRNEKWEKLINQKVWENGKW